MFGLFSLSTYDFMPLSLVHSRRSRYDRLLIPLLNLIIANFAFRVRTALMFVSIDVCAVWDVAFADES
jgi:hypothetical protein